MTKLSVNVNKVATLRNSRAKDKPNVVNTALDIIRFGAHGITVHPRPDGRHIRRQDVYDLRRAISVELNVEGYPSPDFLDLIEDVRPAQATLVPDPPEAITSNSGWRIAPNSAFLGSVIEALKASGTRVSVFVEPQTVTQDELRSLHTMGCDRVELYTELFADSYADGHPEKSIAAYRNLADMALSAGLALNAGHDLDQQNLSYLLQHIPEIQEVSIGHALVCESLYQGFETTIENYLRILKQP